MKRNRITQKMLAEYVELQQLDHHRQELREEIIAMLQAGVRIEPGQYAVQLRELQVRTLTRANLEALIGKDEVETLRRKMPLSWRQDLYVKPQTAETRRQPIVTRELLPKPWLWPDRKVL